MVRQERAGGEVGEGQWTLFHHDKIPKILPVIQFGTSNIEEFGDLLQIVFCFGESFKNSISKRTWIVFLLFIPFPGLNTLTWQKIIQVFRTSSALNIKLDKTSSVRTKSVKHDHAVKRKWKEKLTLKDRFFYFLTHMQNSCGQRRN